MTIYTGYTFAKYDVLKANEFAYTPDLIVIMTEDGNFYDVDGTFITLDDAWKFFTDKSDSVRDGDHFFANFYYTLADIAMAAKQYRRK